MTEINQKRSPGQLRFAPDEERAYQDEHYARYRRALRIGCSIMAALNLGFLVADFPEVIRTGSIWAMVTLIVQNLSFVGCSFLSSFARWWQPFVLGWTVIGAPFLFGSMAQWIAAAPYVPDPIAKLMFYETRSLIFMVWPFALLRLQFRWMLAFQSIVVISSLTAALLWLPGDEWRIWSEYGKQFAPTLLLIMLAAYGLERAQRSAYLANRLLDLERAKSEAVLNNALPASVAERLKRTETIADDHSEATVLFADIADFTAFSAHKSAREVLVFLNEIFSRFDRLVDVHGLEKIKTVGDCYMAVAGAPIHRKDHIEAGARLALAMQNSADQLCQELETPIRFRIGLHTGPLIAGVIGEKRFLYDVWGDTVNTASRLESHGVPGEIQVSEAIVKGLAGRFAVHARGKVELKGKGLVETYFLGPELPKRTG